MSPFLFGSSLRDWYTVVCGISFSLNLLLMPSFFVHPSGAAAVINATKAHFHASREIEENGNAKEIPTVVL